MEAMKASRVGLLNVISSARPNAKRESFSTYEHELGSFNSPNPPTHFSGTIGTHLEQWVCFQRRLEWGRTSEITRTQPINKNRTYRKKRSFDRITVVTKMQRITSPEILFSQPENQQSKNSSKQKHAKSNSQKPM